MQSIYRIILQADLKRCCYPTFTCGWRRQHPEITLICDRPLRWGVAESDSRSRLMFLPKGTCFIDSDLCAFGCPSLMDYKALNNASHERRAPQTCLEPDRLLGIKLMSSPQRVLIYSDCAHPLFGSRSQALSATTEQFRNRHFNNDQNSSNSSSS